MFKFLLVLLATILGAGMGYLSQPFGPWVLFIIAPVSGVIGYYAFQIGYYLDHGYD